MPCPASPASPGSQGKHQPHSPDILRPVLFRRAAGPGGWFWRYHWSKLAVHPASASNRPVPVAAPLARKPSWLKVKAPGGDNYLRIKRLMRELGLHTVCEEARCPNIGECWEHKAATFMILGDVCTRNCAYCAVAHGTPKPFDPVEPIRLAEAVAEMGLAHVVITSVDRDDLENGGAEAFAGCITEIRARLPETTVEVLIPDFKGSERALRLVMDARPDILNHNLETAERLYPMARPGGRYERALRLLANARDDGRSRCAHEVRHHPRHGRGMGRDSHRDARPAPERREHPHPGPVPAAHRRPPSRGAVLFARGVRRAARRGLAMGFTHVQASPLTRSSYHAWEQARAAGAPSRTRGSADGDLRRVAPARRRRPRRGRSPPYLRQMMLIRRFEEKGGRGIQPRQDRRLLSPVHRTGSRRGRHHRRRFEATTTSSPPIASTARRWRAA